jgi:formiminoglutamase
MPGASSRPDGWWSVLDLADVSLFQGNADPDDPRLGDVTYRWDGEPYAIRAGQPVLIGFPCDEGVRRNQGRVGAGLAPYAIRGRLYRLTTWDAPAAVDLAGLGLADVGNVAVGKDLGNAQRKLGTVVTGIFRAGGVPVILGGGHETAYGHYLGYVGAGLECGIINVDAHLDVRPYPDGPHSGSAFRQAMELACHPLRPGRYVVIGAQRQSVAREHLRFVEEHGGRVHWLRDDGGDEAVDVLAEELRRLGGECDAVMVTVDADAFRQSEVPGASAPSPVGLEAAVWPRIALLAGADPRVRSLEVVEVNPRYDRDSQTARWAALGVRQFLVGLARRGFEAHPGGRG